MHSVPYGRAVFICLVKHALTLQHIDPATWPKKVMSTCAGRGRSIPFRVATTPALCTGEVWATNPTETDDARGHQGGERGYNTRTHEVHRSAAACSPRKCLRGLETRGTSPSSP